MERPILSTMERISERTSEIRSKLKAGFGKAGVKGRDERKERALDTVLPKQTLPYALFTAKRRKKSLDKADDVIHGAPRFHDGLEPRPTPLCWGRESSTIRMGLECGLPRVLDWAP